jgi:hypothetical protein
MDADYFFYYGQVDQRAEIEAELLAGAVQGKRTMFYHRSYGAGVSDHENAPIGLATSVALRYELASWVARRNLEVSDGSRGYRDRRAVTSQSAIEVTNEGGSVEVRMGYIPFFDWRRPGEIPVPVGG